MYIIWWGGIRYYQHATPEPILAYFYRVQSYKKIFICAIVLIKNIFFLKNIWSCQKKVVILHPEL